MDDTSRQPRARAEHVADRLHSASLHLLRALRVEDAASGLSAPRLSALSVVVFGGPLRITELARAEQVSAATISRLVAALEADGLVRRKSDPLDARARLVEATPAGRRVLREGRRRRIAALASQLERCDDDELEHLEVAAARLESISVAAARHARLARYRADGAGPSLAE